MIGQYQQSVGKVVKENNGNLRYKNPDVATCSLIGWQ